MCAYRQRTARLAAEIAKAGEQPDVVLEATYGWYWAVDVLQDAGAEVHLAHPLGVKGFAYRRVKNDQRDAADLADLLRMNRLPEAYVAPDHQTGQRPDPLGRGRSRPEDPRLGRLAGLLSGPHRGTPRPQHRHRRGGP